MRPLWLIAGLVLMNAHLRLNVLLIHYILSYGRRQRQLIVGNTLPIPVLDLSLPSTVVLMEFTDSEWRENFPMSRSSFSWLCVVVDPFMRPEETTVRALPMRGAIVLYKLGSCGEYRLVANQFGVHKSTVKKFVYMFCHGMIDTVVKNFIKAPDMEEATQIAARFRRAFGLPQIIVLFILSSTLQRAMEVEGAGVHFYVIGDPAYPLLHWLIKGNTRARNLTAEEKSFNVHVSAARTCVEMAFGRLKARWRILLKIMDVNYTFCPFLIVTCCALHNFCERDTANPRWMQEATTFEAQLPQPGNPPANNANEMGRTVREAITNYMAANFPLRQVEVHFSQNPFQSFIVLKDLYHAILAIPK
uniref:DDE Tnp4 domain-containing protein n=1 Tax=Neogobius melanostomus TaxID=47308 RepID=A0A8C6SSH1_9GOBI